MFYTFAECQPHSQDVARCSYLLLQRSHRDNTCCQYWPCAPAIDGSSVGHCLPPPKAIDCPTISRGRAMSSGASMQSPFQPGMSQAAYWMVESCLVVQRGIPTFLSCVGGGEGLERFQSQPLSHGKARASSHLASDCVALPSLPVGWPDPSPLPADLRRRPMSTRLMAPRLTHSRCATQQRRSKSTARQSGLRHWRGTAR